MDSLQKHLKNIIKANDENRLTVFVGAGLSKSSNTDVFTLPSWEDLISSLKSDLSLNDETDYLKVAQLYFLEFKEPAYYNKINEFFPDYIEPSKVHELLFELMPQCIITTNWDNILEKAIEKNGYLYDVICSDKDLVKSTNHSKVIKMHGDFKSHNIVFKEDDYLNYSHNFPLIENFVKSILSTNTVLFLGYQYNDMNLKHIMKWIQNHSDFCPPMYLTLFDLKDSQKKYLDNHGITTLHLDNSWLQDNSFNDLLDDKSKIIAKFIDNLKNKISKNSKIYTENDVISFVYEKIQDLNNLNYILLDQIRSALTNCGYDYLNNGLCVINFYSTDGILTYDYNKNIRELYSQFISIIDSYDKFDNDGKKKFIKKNPKFQKILLIFAKAKIAGIVTSEGTHGSKMYFENPELSNFDILFKSDREFLSFNFEVMDKENNIKTLSNNAFNYYQRMDYVTAFNQTLELISICKKTRNYSMLLIALFNRNQLLRQLKFSFKHNKNFDDITEIDFHGEYVQFPKEQINKLKSLYDFLALNKLHEIAYYSSSKLLEIEQKVEGIKKGTIYFNNNSDEPKVKQIELLLFAIKNCIMIDCYKVYRTTLQNFVKISMLRQSVKNTIRLNQYELYICIKIFDPKDLLSLYDIFFSQKRDLNNSLVITDSDLDWLISSVLLCIKEQFISSSDIANRPEKELQNLILLLSIIKLNKDYTKDIMSVVSELISSKGNTISTYESINRFLANQYHLFHNEIEKQILIEITENILHKVANGNINAWDEHALTTNTIDNLFGYLEVTEAIFTNTTLIENILVRLKKVSIETKIKYSKSLLYSIYKIGNTPVKTKLRKFIKQVIKEYAPSHLESNDFELWSIAVDFSEFNKDSVQRIKTFLKPYESGDKFSSQLFTIYELVNFLVKEKKINEFKSVQALLKKLISEYRRRDNPSSI